MERSEHKSLRELNPTPSSSYSWDNTCWVWGKFRLQLTSLCSVSCAVIYCISEFIVNKGKSMAITTKPTKIMMINIVIGPKSDKSLFTI